MVVSNRTPSISYGDYYLKKEESKNMLNDKSDNKLTFSDFIFTDDVRCLFIEMDEDISLINKMWRTKLSSDSDNKKTLMNIFPESRGFTKEEAKLHKESLKEMFEPTEVNFFE